MAEWATDRQRPRSNARLQAIPSIRNMSLSLLPLSPIVSSLSATRKTIQRPRHVPSATCCCWRPDSQHHYGTKRVGLHQCTISTCPITETVSHNSKSTKWFNVNCTTWFGLTWPSSVTRISYKYWEIHVYNNKNVLVRLRYCYYSFT